MQEEELRRTVKEKKPIILIGGVSSSGKTTIGNALLCSIGIDHSIGTGWIREIIATQLKKEDYPELFTHSFRPTNKVTPFENFRNGTKSLLPAVEACVKRARREGTSLIIEGVYLMPDINKGLYDFFFFLKKKENVEEYKKMVFGKSHNKRKIFESDIEANIEIEKELVKICEKTNTPIIPENSVERRKKIIIDIMLKKYKEDKNGS